MLEEALQAVFNNQPFSYSIQNKIIVLRSKTEVADKKEPAAIVVQTLPIRGKVNSDDGESLSGAVVTLKRTGKTAVTNERGEFVLTVDPAEAAGGTLIVTYSGYVATEIRISNRRSCTNAKLGNARNRGAGLTKIHI